MNIEYYFQNVIYKFLLTFSPKELSKYRLICNTANSSYKDNIKYYLTQTFSPKSYHELADAIRFYNTNKELAIIKYTHISYWNMLFINVNRKDLIALNS